MLCSGKPSQPLIVGDREGRERYTYDLEWEVRSAYPIAAHEVAYWESDKVHTLSQTYCEYPHIHTRNYEKFNQFDTY